MAKLEKKVNGNFKTIVEAIDNAVMQGSMSASFEDNSTFSCDGVEFVHRVYERYSWTGSNRVSMSVTVIGKDGVNFVSIITSGGSQGLIFKVNTFGEEAFLDTVRDTLDNL